VKKSKQNPQLCAEVIDASVDCRNATGGAGPVKCIEGCKSVKCRSKTSCLSSRDDSIADREYPSPSHPQPPSLAALNSAASNRPFNISSASTKLLLAITCAAFTGPFFRVKSPFVFSMNAPHDTFEIDPGFSLLSIASCPLSLSAPSPRSRSTGFIG
jgi:hypothetical protein